MANIYLFEKMDHAYLLYTEMTLMYTIGGGFNIFFLKPHLGNNKDTAIWVQF